MQGRDDTIVAKHRVENDTDHRNGRFHHFSCGNRESFSRISTGSFVGCAVRGWGYAGCVLRRFPIPGLLLQPDRSWSPFCSIPSGVHRVAITEEGRGSVGSRIGYSRYVGVDTRGSLSSGNDIHRFGGDCHCARVHGGKARTDDQSDSDHALFASLFGRERRPERSVDVFPAFHRLLFRTAFLQYRNHFRYSGTGSVVRSLESGSRSGHRFFSAYGDAVAGFFHGRMARPFSSMEIAQKS